MHSALKWFGPAIFLAAAAFGQGLKSTPATLTFSHQLGAATLPASQTLAVAPASGAAVDFTAAVSGGSWLIVSPVSARTNASVKVTVNPTGLSVGNYTATVVLTPVGGTALNVPITLTVKAPPATLVATPSPVVLSYTRGGAMPDPVALTLSGGGALLSYSITISGATWLSATPKTGIIFPAFTAQVALTADPTGLSPGIYKGTVKIDAPLAANKTTSVSVEMTVNPGAPTLTDAFPAGVTQGATATTITLSGTNFYSGTVVKAGNTTLQATLLGATAIQVVIPAALLATSGTLALTVSNPDPGGGTSAARSFTIYAPGPRITGITNGASFQSGMAAPCEFINIFGSGLGPDTIVTFQPPSGSNPIANALAGVTVTVGTTAVPLIFVSSTQIAAMVPCLITGVATSVTVRYNGADSQPFGLSLATSAPGLFALGASGGGPGAVFNVNDATGDLTLNTETNQVLKGSSIWLYATGVGQTTPASQDGALAFVESSFATPVATLSIGGVDVTPDYFGPSPGLVSGLVLIKAKVPSSVAAGKAVPVVLTVNGAASQSGVTIAVK